MVNETDELNKDLSIVLDQLIEESDDEAFHNAIITIIAHKTKSYDDFITETELEKIWVNQFKDTPSEYKMIAKRQSALKQLITRGVVIEDRTDNYIKYKIAMDLFRLFWKRKNPDIKRELESLVLYD